MKKLIQIMTKYPVVVLLLAVVTISHAQAGINTKIPDASAELEIKSPNSDKGLLVPRLTTAQKNAITSPATGLMLYDSTLNCITVNNGTPTVPDWGCTVVLSRKFFYMPSINISTSPSKIGILQTKDLYAQYASEFGSPKMASTGAPSSIPHFENAADLNYYITYYDPAIIEIISIDANGVMTYKLLKTANYDSYLNIVFVPK